jgi:hypothetical protein
LGEKERNKRKPEKMYNEELHNFTSSPNIIRMIKSKKMGCEGHVERMGRRILHTGFGWENEIPRLK